MTFLRPADAVVLSQACERIGLTDPKVTPLDGGTRNRLYRLQDADHDVVLRIAGEHDGQYAVARAAEFTAQRLAAEHGLAPSLLLADAAAGIAVSACIPTAPWSREYAASPAGAARAGAWMARLHALAVPDGLRRVDFLSSLRAYVAELGGGADGAVLLASGGRVAAGLGAVPPAVCHNDLHHLNLLDGPRGLQVIDWEYAGTGDPRFDLAGYVAYHDLDGAAQSALLEAYGGGPAAVSTAGLAAARWLFEAVWWAWLALRFRLEGAEPPDLAEARQRLSKRLTGRSGGSQGCTGGGGSDL